MRLPVIRGLIDRRILVNFQVDPAELAERLPAPFRPRRVRGTGMAGICLIRLKQVRPRGMPAFLGMRSENAAHRIAVEWDEAGEVRQGVYIPRRDTSLWFNSLAGGRLFPGVHHHARFQVREHDDDYRIQLDSDDGITRLLVEGRQADRLPADSVFASIQEASAFFEAGSLGYSPAACPGVFDGLELRTFGWQVEPLALTQVESSYFAAFPPGSVHFDSALLMRQLDHEWHGRPALRLANHIRARKVSMACRKGPCLPVPSSVPWPGQATPIELDSVEIAGLQD